MVVVYTVALERRTAPLPTCMDDTWFAKSGVDHPSSHVMDHVSLTTQAPRRLPPNTYYSTSTNTGPRTL